MISRCSFAVKWIFVVFFMNTAYSHVQNLSEIEIYVNGDTYTVSWTVAMQDLVRVVPLDVNDDNAIQWQEVIKSKTLLTNLVKTYFIINGQQIPDFRISDIQMVKGNESKKLSMDIQFESKKSIESMGYSFLQTIDPTHLVYVTYQNSTSHSKETYLLDNRQRTIKIKNEQQGHFLTYIYQGIVHIFIGWDHLAFLMILLFSAYVAKNQSSDEQKITMKKLFLYVSVFTLAHSMTLILAALDLVYLPSWFVETCIALSVAWGAFLILRGVSRLKTADIFGFGLIHGLGFAGVLNDLNHDAASDIALLLGFNLGVEIGQILFLIAIFFILTVLMKRFSYVWISRVTHVPIFLLSCFWVFERSLGG